LKVAAHAWTEKGARNAAEAGVDSIEHGVRINDETLIIAKSKNIALVPTPFTETDAREGGNRAASKK
jgi:imidazolonepropionase-like amidohydrolase